MNHERVRVFDNIIVGAGHNGLICACYLAKSGHRVLVLERRPIVGGAVCTEEIVPGYRFDVGSSAHIMFPSTGIAEELDLAAHGLEYLEMDPWAYFPIPDTDSGIAFHRSVEETCRSIARVSEIDAAAYARFVEHWGELNEGIFEAFNTAPTPGAIGRIMLRRNLLRPRSRKIWSSLDTTRQLMMSYGRLIEENFENEYLRTAMTWLAAQSGPPPTETASGDFSGWQSMIHKHGAWRAKGGSGSLTQALARCLESLGGEIVTSAPVETIRTAAAPARYEVRAGDQSYFSRTVTAACHVKTALLDLAAPELVPEELRERVRHIRVGNGFGMVVRHAVSELPQYAPEPRASSPLPYHSSLQLLCPSRAYLDAAYHDYLTGRPPSHPAVLAMTFSALDPTLAPPGKHILFTWAQYHPYELSGGKNWDDIAETEADKIWEVVCQYAPNMRGKMIDRFIQTPLEIERRLGLLRANVMHVEMTFDQMFAFRPLPELAGYRTPIEGFYLTGASTHPGGGVFGASGRNAARVIDKDLRSS